ncbi:MAG: hypothetical protein HKN09_03590 [Saprospiraceae bacterium]|nr:hypothetical protein [Saprospiraceae bacterium]
MNRIRIFILSVIVCIFSISCDCNKCKDDYAIIENESNLPAILIRKSINNRNIEYIIDTIPKQSSLTFECKELNPSSDYDWIMYQFDSPVRFGKSPNAKSFRKPKYRNIKLNFYVDDCYDNFELDELIDKTIYSLNRIIKLQFGNTVIKKGKVFFNPRFQYQSGDDYFSPLNYRVKERTESSSEFDVFVYREGKYRELPGRTQSTAGIIKSKGILQSDIKIINPAVLNHELFHYQYSDILSCSESMRSCIMNQAYNVSVGLNWNNNLVVSSDINLLDISNLTSEVILPLDIFFQDYTTNIDSVLGYYQNIRNHIYQNYLSTTHFSIDAFKNLIGDNNFLDYLNHLIELEGVYNISSCSPTEVASYFVQRSDQFLSRESKLKANQSKQREAKNFKVKSVAELDLKDKIIDLPELNNLTKSHNDEIKSNRRSISNFGASLCQIDDNFIASVDFLTDRYWSSTSQLWPQGYLDNTSIRFNNNQDVLSINPENEVNQDNSLYLLRFGIKAHYNTPNPNFTKQPILLEIEYESINNNKIEIKEIEVDTSWTCVLLSPINLNGSLKSVKISNSVNLWDVPILLDNITVFKQRPAGYSIPIASIRNIHYSIESKILQGIGDSISIEKPLNYKWFDHFDLNKMGQELEIKERLEIWLIANYRFYINQGNTIEQKKYEEIISSIIKINPQAEERFRIYNDFVDRLGF